MWIKFFENAGLLPKIATKYSAMFMEHRIQKNMLADLTKPILNEMGIVAIGDILAILKQAKEVMNKDDVEAKEIIMQNVSAVQKEMAAPKGKAVVVIPKVAASPKTTVILSAVQAKRIRLEKPPDHDVVYRVNMPKGTTERSRQLLQKVATITQKTTTTQKSVFERLGAVVKRSQDEMDEEEDGDPMSAVPWSLRKSVSFSPGTKESSPEVTSTTDEYAGKMESDKLARKVSALQRLGTKATNDVVKVAGGERRLLLAKRIAPASVKAKTIFDRLG